MPLSFRAMMIPRNFVPAFFSAARASGSTGASCLSWTYPGHEHEPKRLLHLPDLRPQLLELGLGHLAQLPVSGLVLADFLGVLYLREHVPVRPVVVHHVLDLGPFPGELLVLLVV